MIVTALVPLRILHNADAAGVRRPFDDEKFTQTASEMAQKFGGGTLFRFPEGSSPVGYWWSRGILHMDELAVLEVDMEDNQANRAWMEDYARRVLIDRFEQDAVYVKFYGGGATVQTVAVARSAV